MRRGFLVVMMVTLTVAFSASAQSGMLAAGDTFPSWKMKDQVGREVSSESLAGKTYLLWYYPAALTPGCTVEGEGLRDSYGKFRERGVEIFGVSFDPPEKNREFAELHDFPYRLLSDDGALAQQVGASTSKGQRYAKRISYLVGPDTKVIAAYGTVRPSEHAGEVLADLAGK